MSNNLELIKQLREESGAGMVDCQKALNESGGDMDKALEILRKQGIAKAAKRSDRETAEGVIKAEASGGVGYMVEINSETDFVARNEKFQKFADDVLALIKEKEPKDIEELMALEMNDSTVKEALENLSGVIGEKLSLKRFAILKSEGTVAAYLHMGGRIGVLVALSEKDTDELAHNMAMQIAASDPKYISPDEVPAEEIEKEKEIYREQLRSQGKPENIIDKILTGKINKYFEEVCLLKQDYIKEEKKKVEDILGGVKVEKFIRYSL